MFSSQKNRKNIQELKENHETFKKAMYRLDAHIPKKSSLKISAVYPQDQTRKLLY